MHWKLKASIQNLISMFPNPLSYAVYYTVQRRFGGLRQFNPSKRLSGAIVAWKKIQEQGQCPIDKVFFEVGTGRAPIIPLAYWLMGADSVVTVDLNSYLEEELIVESLKWISENENEVRGLFGPLLCEDRFMTLLSWFRDASFDLSYFLNLCHIEYLAPSDASKTGLPNKTIDYHTSYTVLEHIPSQALVEIFKEGGRIIRDTGLFVHYVDYSDHFSHSDKSISAINFLQYSAEDWAQIAGNRYMYMNRLRHDDFLSLIADAQHDILSMTIFSDSYVKDLLQGSCIKLDQMFCAKSDEVLSITSSWFVTRARW